MSTRIGKLPTAPRNLSQRARTLWRQINQEFELSPDACDILRLALEHMDLGDVARAILKRDGPLLEGKRHPAVGIVKTHDELYLRSMRALGLDVVAPPSAGKRGR